VARVGRNELILDNWAEFSFKPEFDSDRTAEGPWLAPMWVGDHRRRLAAYTMLKAYRSNAARWYLTSLTTEDVTLRDERHEYGDCELLVQSIASALLGDEVRVGAADEDEIAPVYLDWVQEWSKKVRAVRKLTAAEDHAVGEGDGVLVVGWDELAGRPSLMPSDPGFYFPVLEDFTQEFPMTVHLAWEIDTEDESQKRKVRRITYELVKLEDVEGNIRQIKYPWNTGTTEFTCLWSDGEWELGEKASVEDLEPGQATWNQTPSGVPINKINLGIDFIPVVHIPNTISDEEHFGRSSLASVLQLLDEISAAYTDLSKGAAIAGFPPLASEGGAFTTDATGAIPSYGPGTVFNGKLSSVDTSAGLKVLMEYIMFLLKVLNTNSRVPEVLLGRVDPSNVPSGVAIRLMFTQMKMMIQRMRLVRDEKWPLVFKFAGRFAMLNNQIPATTDWPELTFIPGQFIPSDLESLVTTVIAAVNGKVISLETGIEMLMEAGVPIQSIDDEIAKIQSRDFTGAQQVGLALGSDQAAADHLGRELPTDPSSNVALDDSEVE
jgi:hypothetical protein